MCARAASMKLFACRNNRKIMHNDVCKDHSAARCCCWILCRGRIPVTPQLLVGITCQKRQKGTFNGHRRRADTACSLVGALMPLRQLPCCVVMTLWVKTRRPPLAFIIVQTVCKQLSVQKWMKSRAKFPPRPGVCPEGLTHKVIPSTGSQSLFWVCVWKLYNEAACVCLELQMECEEDNGR